MLLLRGLRSRVIWRVLRRNLSLLVFAILVLTVFPLVHSASDSELTWHVQTSSDDAKPTGDADPTPNGVIPIQVTNPSPFPRPKEVVWYKLILRDFQLFDATQVLVRNATSGSEILSGSLPSTAKKHPSGFIREIDVVFQDDFAPFETKSYQVVTGMSPSLTGDMIVTPSGSYIDIDDGASHYEVQTSHELSFWSQGVYVSYSNGSSVSSRSSILVRVGGNQLVLDHTNFQLAWGPPIKTQIDQNNVMVSIYLEYRAPIMVNWGFGFAQELYKTTDTIFADVRINIYNDRAMVESITKKKINEKMYNHNGFVMEFSVLYAGHGEYQTIFGNSNYTITTGKTLSYYWERRTPSSFDGIDVGNHSAPAFADLDADNDFDLILGNDNGTLVYYENTGSSIAPIWALDPTVFASVGDLGNRTKPYLADLDDDGDLDLTTGVKDGLLFYYENTGSPFAPSWTNMSNMYSGIDVGDYAAPTLADVDGDGDFDLSIGKEDGTIVYYENTGNLATPVWTKNDALFYLLNAGNTKKPGLYSTPEFADADADGLIDFISGTDEAPYMAVNLFLNTGDTTDPNFSKLSPHMVNTVRGGSTAGDKDYSSPRMVDLDGDGDLDFAIGFADGTLVYWENLGLYKAQRGVNTMDPLPNGTYRFYKDQDGNDGQYVVENYSYDFFDYYVVANPATGAAILRYVPDFAEQVYRDKYAGDEYPWAGGNVSFYPFVPEEDGYVTRGIAISRPFYDPPAGTTTPGMSAGTFLSQTGTAAGFIQVPMTPMSYDSKEILLTEMPYTTDCSFYDQVVERLKTPLDIIGIVDLTVTSSDIHLTPNEPDDGDLVIIEAEIINQGQERGDSVDVEFFDGNPDLGGTQIGPTVTIDYIEKESSDSAFVAWDTTGKAGAHDIFVRVDYASTVFEMDDDNNNATRQVHVTDWYKNWDAPIQITDSHYNDLDPAVVEDSNGRAWIAWHTYTTEDNFDIFAKNYSSGVWSPTNPVGTGIKRTSRPSLAADDSGNVWMAYSSNIVEYDDYIATKHAKYYWSQKFDIYARKFDGTQWITSDQISFAEVLDHSDNTPWVVVTSKGEIWITYRHTHFQFYTAGHQMDNIPYQDMNISAVYHNGSAWSSEIIVDDSIGSQGWWGGPKIVEDHDGNIWIFYGSEMMNTQWDIFYAMYNGTGWTGPVRLTTDPAHDYRPSACVDSNGNIWVIWESNRNGNKDIFSKYYNGTSWSSDIQVTTDEGWDIKSAATSDSNGNVWVAWESDRNGNKDIFLKRHNSSQWSHDIQVTTNTHADEEVALHAGNATGNIWIVWETDRNGHGNKDIYARILSPTDAPIPKLEGISDLTATVQGSDIVLDWTAPVFPDLSHYLIYRSEIQTDFDFAALHHNTSGDTNPLNTSWIDTDAAGPGAPPVLYYVVRPVDTNGRSTFTDYTIGKWTKWFNRGRSAFSLPLEPLVQRNVSYYVSAIPNVQFIRWMDSNGKWMNHSKGMGPGINDAVVRMGEAYEIYLDAPTEYSFLGRPASMIRYNDGFGESLAHRYSLTATAVSDDIVLNWTQVQGAEYYLVYRFGTRGSLPLESPAFVTDSETLTWTDIRALSDPGENYYLVVPVDSQGELGSSTYSIGVIVMGYLSGSDTFALPLESEDARTLDWFCDEIPYVVGMAYMIHQVWKFHIVLMPEGVYDVEIKQGGGYQISVEGWVTRFTFIGY